MNTRTESLQSMLILVAFLLSGAELVLVGTLLLSRGLITSEAAIDDPLAVVARIAILLLLTAYVMTCLLRQRILLAVVGYVFLIVGCLAVGVVLCFRLVSGHTDGDDSLSGPLTALVFFGSWLFLGIVFIRRRDSTALGRGV